MWAWSLNQTGRLSNHFLALGLRWGQPGQQQGRRLPAWRSSTARSIRRLRVALCFAVVTQQIHSFRAKGVNSFHAARAIELEPIALDRSAGARCRGPELAALFIEEYLELLATRVR